MHFFSSSHCENPSGHVIDSVALVPLVLAATVVALVAAAIVDAVPAVATVATMMMTSQNRQKKLAISKKIPT
jgi:hypothetical protein